MHAHIAQLDIRLRRRGLIGYPVGMAAYVLIVVAVYPAFKDSTSLNKLTEGNSALAALFGVTGSLTSSGGWLNANIYENFFPLLMLLVTIGYGASCLAGQDEDGTLSLIATLPVRRSVIVVQKIAAMVTQAVVLALTVAVCVLAGQSFELTINVGRVFAVSAAVTLMAVAFGLVAMAVGALTGSRGTGIAVGSATATASYLISSLAPVANWIRPARFASLFYWSVGNDQITNGLSLTDGFILAIVVIMLSYAVIAVFHRADLR